MPGDREKPQAEKLEDALFIQWRKREKFVVLCLRLGFTVADLLLISGQYYFFENN